MTAMIGELMVLRKVRSATKTTGFALIDRPYTETMFRVSPLGGVREVRQTRKFIF